MLCGWPWRKWKWRITVEIARILKRDWSNCWATGRNIGDTRWTCVRRSAWMLFYTAKAVIIAARFVKHEQLGSRVVWNGKPWTVHNWAGCPYVTLINEERVVRHKVPREQFVQVRSAGELWHRFTFGFQWWMGSWFGIAVNKRLYPEAYWR